MNVENELMYLVSNALGNAKEVYPELRLTESLNTLDNYWRGVKSGMVEVGGKVPSNFIKINELLEPIYHDCRDEKGRWIRIYPRSMNGEYMNWLRNQLQDLIVYLGQVNC